MKNRTTLLLPFLLTLTACAPSTAVIDLHDSLEPLRQRFNAERDRPRILAVFSPT